MATSGSTDFDLSRDEIISTVAANVGAIGPGQSATGKVRAFIAEALNRTCKALDAEGKFLWRVVRRSLTLTAGTATYALTSTNTDVLEVEEPMNYRTSSAATSRTPVGLMSRDDYMRITDRTIQGVPNLAFVEYVLPTTVNLTLYPTPNTTSAVLEYAAVLRASDFDAGADTGDYPARWLQCLVYGTTAAVAPAFKQVDLMLRMQKLFEEEKERQMNAGAEKGTTFFVPFGSWY